MYSRIITINGVRTPVIVMNNAKDCHLGAMRLIEMWDCHQIARTGFTSRLITNIDICSRFYKEIEQETS